MLASEGKARPFFWTESSTRKIFTDNLDTLYYEVSKIPPGDKFEGSRMGLLFNSGPSTDRLPLPTLGGSGFRSCFFYFVLIDGDPSLCKDIRKLISINREKKTVIRLVYSRQSSF